MNADLLAMFSGGGMGVGSSAMNRQVDEGKVLVSIKAGKMDAIYQAHNGKYLIKPNEGQRRGVIQLVWQLGAGGSASSSSNSTNTAIASGVLKFEWKDRRTDAKDLESVIFPEDRCTITKVGRDTDRVYLFQYHSDAPNAGGSTSPTDQPRRHFFYLQDKNTENDDALLTKFSRLLHDRAACIIEAGGIPTPADYSSSSTAAPSTTATTTTTTTTSMTTTTTATTTAPAPAIATVDALSSILENLGMPLQTNNTTTTPPTIDGAAVNSSNATAAASTSASAGGGILTLSDLQGAMAGLATHSPLASTGGTTSSTSTRAPPLQEILTADSVEASGILNDPTVRQRLMDLLPENQRTEDDLRQNLRSPQVQQALQSLSAAIGGGTTTTNEDTSSAFHNVIVNFSMNPDDGAISLANGDPIQAFLDCLLASVQREQVEEGNATDNQKEEHDEEENKMYE